MRHRVERLWRSVLVGVAGIALSVSAASAQVGATLNPVYPDDSPVARETLQRIAEFTASNPGQAVHELQRLLDEQGDRVVAQPNMSGVFVGVRAQVHARLLAEPKLLELYRTTEEATARKMLERGEIAELERTRMLTPSGFEATLRVAQEFVEAAQFEAARITLEELESHPDRARSAEAIHRRDAASLMTLVARYLDRAEVWERAERWSLEAGAPLGERPKAFPRPAVVTTPVLGIDRVLGIPPREAVPIHPLCTTKMQPIELPEEPGNLQDRPAPPEQLTENAWVFPKVVGDTIYVNDGTFVTARDRYTLRPRWSVHPMGDGNVEDAYAARRNAASRSTGRQLQDASGVSVQGRTVVATMGLAMGNARDGAPMTVAIDAITGKVLWSVDVSRLDPILDSSSVRGAALVSPLEGGTVVLLARKPAQGRRTVALYMVGLSLETGDLRWVRPIASAGSIPWSQADRRIGWSGTLHEGIVYAVDPLGAIAAVEGATGRVCWVRLAPVPAMIAPGPIDVSMPWQWGEPIVDGNAVVTLSPDRAQVLRLDRATGGIVGKRAASDLGDPMYLLSAGTQLISVGQEAVTIVPIDQIAEGMVRRVAIASKGDVRGRVMVSSDALLVPRSDGLAILSLAGGEPKTLPLESSGNVLALADQLIVVDAVNLHSYLSWEMADRLLTKRMRDEPDNPEPAVTAVQLAYHAGHPERIAASADAALAIIDREPERSASERERLFGVLREMIESSQSRWGAESAKLDQARATDAVLALDLPWMGEAITRLGRAARSPSERVTHLFALGRFEDVAGKGGLAAEAYQRVLEEPALASTSVRAGMVTIRADLEATRRVRQLVQDQGPQAYGAFAGEAAQRLASLKPGSLEDLRSLAQAFPAAPASCAAWLRVAELHEAAGRPQAVIAALREAMDVAETLRDASDVASIPLGEIVGRLVETLQKQDRAFSAAQLLARIHEQSPGLALTSHGRPIDDVAMLSDLRTRLGKLQRLPRVGPQIRGEPQAIADWSLMQPQSRANIGRACEQVMMISSRNTRVALWGGSGGGQMEPLWWRSTANGTPVLLRYDAQTVDLIWDRLPEHAPKAMREMGGDGPTIERIGALDGKTRWFSTPLPRLLPPIQQRGFDGGRREGLVIGFGEQAVAIFDRSGRGACLDAETGRVLWTRQFNFTTLSDVVVGGGVIGLGGGRGDAARNQRVLASVLMVDARTGEIQHKFEQAGGSVRWLRLAGIESNAAGDVAGDRSPALALIAGLGNSVISFDPTSGRTNWTIGGAGGAAASVSLEAWAFGDRLFLVDSGRSLWMVPIATGQVPTHPIDLGDRLSSTAQLEATALSGGRTAFTSERGMCIIDANGKVVGSDSVSGPQEIPTMIPPMAAQDGFVAVETLGHEGENGYRLHIMDARSCMLRSTRLLGGLELPPRRAAVIDGRIIVTAGPNSVVYPAPEEGH